jgi:FtsH-binding integral membrane protein
MESRETRDEEEQDMEGTSTHTRQAYQILHFGFTVAPIVAGLDKFLHLLVNWDQYLAPVIARMLPFSGHTFMLIVGVIEIVAGLLVWFKPRLGAYVVMAWLWGIIIDLLLVPGYYDIALRDFGLSLGALALARLSEVEVTVPAAARVRNA